MLLQDLRYGARMLAKNPGFTAAAVVCLGLGMGATTAIFSVVNAVVVRPLPYSRPAELVRVYTEFPTFPNGGLRRFWVSAPELLDLQRETQSWTSLEGWVLGAANLAGATEPVRVTEAYLTGGMMQSLGATPLIGRILSPRDDGPGGAFSAPPVAVISYGLWQRAFGGDPGILGRDIRHDGAKCTVIGVMPKGFAFPPSEGDPAEMWVPLQIDPARPGNRGGHFLSLLGRLKPGVSLRQAQAELAQFVNRRAEKAAPNTHDFNLKFHPIVSFPFHDEVVGNVKLAMLMLLGAVAFVLLIACVNVANLLLARAEARQREIAVRTAMGAALPRLVAQFVTEGVLLSLAGAALGVLLAWGGVRLIATTNAGSIPRAAEIGIDRAVLLFAVAVSCATGLFFGLSPIAHMRTANLADSLKTASGRTTSGLGSQLFRRVLVVAELALALVLLIGSGLMVRAFWKLQEVQSGFRPEGVLSLRVALNQITYPDAQATTAFWNRVQERLSAIPGVESVSFMTGMPPVRPLNANDTQIEGFVSVPNGPIQNVDYWNTVGKRYFETMGIRLVEGRLFDERDGQGGAPSVIINQAMARHFWGTESPIGRRIRPGDPWRTIVGVVADVKNAGLDKPAGTELYLPYAQLSGRRNVTGGYLLLRAKGDPKSLAGSARAAIHEIDAALPLAQVRTLEDVVSRAQSRPRFLTLLLTLFSSVALALAAVGIYGVISYSVAQRTNEIGVRMALGADSTSVLRMVLVQGGRLGLLGVAIGAAGALALTRLIRGLLFGISSFDPLTFILMAALLTAVTLAACYVPARRATRVDPLIALRYE